MKKSLLGLLALVMAWTVAVNQFVMFSGAKRVLDDGAVDVPWTFTIPMYVGGAIGMLADVAVNISYGTIAYQEFPQEWTFSERAKRHLASSGWRQEKAEEWCALLETFDPTHCD